jgi:hypothetical protein
LDGTEQASLMMDTQTEIKGPYRKEKEDGEFNSLLNKSFKSNVNYRPQEGVTDLKRVI